MFEKVGMSDSKKAVSSPEISLSWKKKATYTILIFIVFLFALEGMLRVVGIADDVEGLRQDGGIVQSGDGRLGLSYTPGWTGYYAGAMTTINSAGWRGPEFSPEKMPGKTRILGVGDSFVFGKAVNDEETFLFKLEQKLNAEGNGNYETINAGVERINTVGALRRFKEKNMLGLAPDVVVLGFTVRNDAQDSRNRSEFRKLRRRGSFLLRLSSSDGFKSFADYSRIVRILRSGAQWAVNGEETRLYYDIILKNYADDSRTWNNCREALLGFAEICRENRIPLVFVIFPMYTVEISQTYKDYPEDFRNVHKKLEAVFSGIEGVTVIDMLDDLTATELKVRDLTVPIDMHPNAIWHEVLAGKLYSVIRKINSDAH